MDQNTIAFARRWARRYMREHHPHGFGEADIENMILRRLYYNKDIGERGQKAALSSALNESLTLVAADGATKVADITVVSTKDGQRITCALASAVPAGTYYVRLVSHGLDPTVPLVTALHKVSVKAAAIPPAPEPVGEPTITGANTQGADDGDVNVAETPPKGKRKREKEGAAILPPLSFDLMGVYDILSNMHEGER